jgi:hypothetical protein
LNLTFVIEHFLKKICRLAGAGGFAWPANTAAAAEKKNRKRVPHNLVGFIISIPPISI